MRTPAHPLAPAAPPATDPPFAGAGLDASGNTSGGAGTAGGGGADSGGGERRAGWAGERGSATVEAAIAVCAVVVVLAIALAGTGAVFAQLRCMDAAREAARLVARGEQGRAEQVARRVAPSGAAVVISVEGDEVVVDVRAEPMGGFLPGLDVGAEAVAVLEPGVGGAG